MDSSKRPLSPHLQIYRPQITSVMSISHRVSGVALSAGSLLLIYWLAAAAGGPEAFASAQSLLGSWFGRLVLFLFTLGLFYHLFNGIRHLFWDMGRGFDLASVYRSGYAVLGAAGVTSVLVWVVALVAGRGV